MGRSRDESELIYRACEDYGTFMHQRERASSDIKRDYDRLWNCIRTFKSTRKLNSLDVAFQQHRTLVLNSAAKRRATQEEDENEESFSTADEDDHHESSEIRSPVSHHDGTTVKLEPTDTPVTPLTIQPQSVSSVRHYETMEEMLTEFGNASRRITQSLVDDQNLRDDFMAIFTHLADSMDRPERIRVLRKFLLDSTFLHAQQNTDEQDIQSPTTVSTHKRSRRRVRYETPVRVRQTSPETGLQFQPTPTTSEEASSTHSTTSQSLSASPESL
jgi:hypothetical protein